VSERPTNLVTVVHGVALTNIIQAAASLKTQVSSVTLAVFPVTRKKETGKVKPSADTIQPGQCQHQDQTVFTIAEITENVPFLAMMDPTLEECTSIEKTASTHPKPVGIIAALLLLVKTVLLIHTITKMSVQLVLQALVNHATQATNWLETIVTR
jgi:hypothetical protein